MRAREEGVDVRGVTVWAAFGTVDWSSLLTRDAGHYEPGAWDIRSDPPRLTALGRLAAALAESDPARAQDFHPVLASPGWWQRDLRLSVTPHGDVTALPARGAPLLILGTGALARAFGRLCHMRGLPYEMLDDKADLADAIHRHAAWAVIDTVERDPGRRLALNQLAAGLRKLVVSSHELMAVAAAGALVVLTSAPFGPWDQDDFVARGLALLRQGREWTAAEDEIVEPAYLPDLVQASLDLLIDGETGVWHLANGEALSWAAFARRAAGHAGLDTSLVRGAPARQLDQVRQPIRHAPDGRGRGMLPSLADALARYQLDHEPVPAPVPPLRAAADQSMG